MTTIPAPAKARFRDLLPYFLEHRAAFVGVSVLSVIGALGTLAQPLLVQQIVGRVQAGTGVGSLAWVVVALLIVTAGLSAVQHYLLQKAGTAVVLTARRTLVSRLLRLPIAEYDQRRTGDLVTRVGGDTQMLYAVMTQGLLDLVGGAFTFIGALIGMAILDWVLLVIVLVIVVVMVGIVGLLSRRVRTASRVQQDRVGALAAGVERALGAIRTIRAANATDREVGLVERDAQAAYRAGIDVAKASAVIVPMASIALQVSLLAVLGVGGLRVASGAIPIASLIAFVMFLFMMLMPLGSLFGALTTLNQVLGAVGRIQEILDLPSEGATDAAPGAASRAGSPASRRISGESSAIRAEPRGPGAADVAAIEFEGVGFEYASSPEPVLRGVSFSAPRGRRTALVGPSGAGKSTILALVERFYDVTSGTVRVGGIDVRDESREALRAQIGYVEQDAPALAGTLRENLLIADPDADDARCIDTLRAVNLGEVLDRDPRGLDAEIGEKGIMLSGGERQRLAIARALMTDAPILLLDEATASLDGLNERLLRDAIDAAAADRTMLVIAHRLSTVVDADRIVVLDHGAVLGVGTHAELVESVPLYRDLAAHQLLA